MSSNSIRSIILANQKENSNLSEVVEQQAQKEAMDPQATLEDLSETLWSIESVIDALDEKVEKILAEFENITETLEDLSEKLQEVMYNEQCRTDGWNER